jgi:SAM-dependent methyltransferase
MLTVNYRILDVRPGHRVLDAGCGAGRHCFEAFRRGSLICGMDYARPEVEKVMYSFVAASEEDQRQGGQWAVLRGDVLSLPFADNLFDRIICAEVLEHLHEDLRAIAELKRVLKPGGRLAVTVPTFFTEAAYGFLSPLYFTNPGGHVRKFMPDELAARLRHLGLKLYAVGHAHAFHSPYWLLRCAFGLANENHPAPATYRKFLVKTILSPTLSRVEKFLDGVFPKSLIIYAQKP